ncbi:MAG: DNA replication complex GINS family protein [Candidatus Heimdallarchaeota archaeon]|nr:DNA replication complex GINS family protein [Candidatus Heimdallarchaeota archaeon]MCK4878028.1 DNA replication complex GINS family protein [Candidatus Heimdallarchaeota archaeon]
MIILILDDLVLDELERIQYDFEEKEISVKCLQSIDEFDIGDKRIKLTKGATMKFPFWIASILEKEEYVEITDVTEIDFPDLYKLAIKEGENIDLQKINNYFYIAMKSAFQEHADGIKTMPYRQKESIEMKLRELMTMRLSKIIKIAEKGKNITSKSRNMTPEEKWLYEIVSVAVEKWKKMIKAVPEESD